MKYPIKSANGHAGEFLFAFNIAHILKWPCRLFDIDIGIDAQVEVINEDRSSTGRFVAFQVKASSLEEPNCRYVTESQMTYWRELGLPVFVVLVNLNTKDMYLHQVLLDKNYHETKNGAIRIDFDLDNDIFAHSSGARISAAAHEVARAHVMKHLEVVTAGVTRIRNSIVSMEEFPDSGLLIAEMESRFALQQELAQAKALVFALRAGENEWNARSQELAEVLDELRGLMNQSFRADHDNDGRIKQFVNEEK